jgi:hypothetical protein
LQPQQLVPLVALLGLEQIQSLRRDAGVVFQRGIPIALELLHTLAPLRNSCELQLGGLAHLIKCSQRRAELVEGHVPLGGEPLVAVPHPFGLGQLDPRLVA